MLGYVGRPLRRPTPAEPLGAGWNWQQVQSARGVGLAMPGRGDMGATAAFDAGSEAEDEEWVDPLPTGRHRRAV